MSTNEKSTKDIAVEFSGFDRGKTMYFDRFDVVEKGEYIFLSFMRSGSADDRFSCVLPKIDIKQVVASFKKYIEKLNKGPTNESHFKVYENSAPLESCPAIRIIRCSSNSGVAEISLFFYPLMLAAPNKTPDKIIATHVATLLSPIQLHIDFICQIITIGESI